MTTAEQIRYAEVNTPDPLTTVLADHYGTHVTHRWTGAPTGARPTDNLAVACTCGHRVSAFPWTHANPLAESAEHRTHLATVLRTHLATGAAVVQLDDTDAPSATVTCALHPVAGEPGIVNARGVTCADDCWTRDPGCPSFDGHRDGYHAPSGESRWCPGCERYRSVCCEDHCLDCGAPT